MSNRCRRSSETSESEDFSRDMDRCSGNRRSGRDGRIGTSSEVSRRRGNNDCDSSNTAIRNHNHEFSAVTAYERDDEGVRHNHSIKGVTGRAIRYGRTHVHKVEEFVTSTRDHFQAICDTTGPAIYFSDGKHIHLIKGKTTREDGHQHDYYFVTQVEDPSDVPETSYC